MSVNKHQAHLLVLPEDDANRRLVNGFLLKFTTRQISVEKVAKGWTKVLEKFKTNHLKAMEQYPDRLLALLIDFDAKDDRLIQVKGVIPDHLQDRVFVLGAWTEPEKLKGPDLGSSFEIVGGALATDCIEGTDTKWNHPLLRHNASELARMRESVCPILFPAEP